MQNSSTKSVVHFIIRGKNPDFAVKVLREKFPSVWAVG